MAATTLRLNITNVFFLIILSPSSWSNPCCAVGAVIFFFDIWNSARLLCVDRLATGVTQTALRSAVQVHRLWSQTAGVEYKPPSSNYVEGVTKPRLTDFLWSHDRSDVRVDNADDHLGLCDSPEACVVGDSSEGAKPGTCLGVWAETSVLGAGQINCNPC